MKTIDRLFLMVIALAALYIAFATCRYHYFLIEPKEDLARPLRIDRFTGDVSVQAWPKANWVLLTPYNEKSVKPAVNP